jgi:hypothetical protein
VRFVGDSGLDDQKFYQLIMRLPSTQCIFRAQHNRHIEVYNERLSRWEHERLFDLAACAYLPVTFATTFTHGRKQQQVTVQLGWFKVRFADLPEPMWVLVVRRSDDEPELVLLTTIPITDVAQARLAFEPWRLRPAIEHTYRFDQEQGLDVEDMRVRSLEARGRLFVLVLLTALFVAHLAATWPQSAVTWLRALGGKLGLTSDLDGLYLLASWHQLRLYHCCHALVRFRSSLPFLLFHLWVITTRPLRKSGTVLTDTAKCGERGKMRRE